MVRGTVTRTGITALVIAVSVSAQQPETKLSKLRTLGLPEAAGSVPVIYVASAKERALRLQKSLQAAHNWYEKQLDIRIPIVLAVLDSETGEKVPVGTALPNSIAAESGPGLIVIPARVPAPPPVGHEEFLQFEPAQFHEDGHIFAYELKIGSGNSFVNELVAQMFAVAYMTAERPDLKWVVEDLRGGRSAVVQTTPRYTSLADLDYLYTGVGNANYVWFQQAALGRLADFLVTGQSFPAVIEKLQKAFPAAAAKQETVEEISRRLEDIRPGFVKTAGSLVGPTTIPRIMPSGCSEPKTDGAPSYLAVRNDTANPVAVTNPDGRDSRIPAHSWRTFRVAVGAMLKLPDGRCLVARDEPALAVIEKN